MARRFAVRALLNGGPGLLDVYVGGLLQQADDLFAECETELP